MDASQYDTPSGANCFVGLYPTTYFGCFLYRCGGCGETSGMIVAEVRIKAVRAAIGDEDVDKAISEAEEEFAQKQNPRHWEIFKHGGKAEREALWNEIDKRELQPELQHSA